MRTVANASAVTTGCIFNHTHILRSFHKNYWINLWFIGNPLRAYKYRENAKAGGLTSSIGKWASLKYEYGYEVNWTWICLVLVHILRTTMGMWEQSTWTARRIVIYSCARTFMKRVQLHASQVSALAIQPDLVIWLALWRLRGFGSSKDRMIARQLS
jgi:hypothetical protein